MRTLKFGTLLVLATLTSTANATTYNTKCTAAAVSDWSSSSAADTGRSFAIAGMAGAKAMCGSVSSSHGSALLTSCASYASSYSDRTDWPNYCPPGYMDDALKAKYYSSSTGYNNWIQAYNGTSQTSGINAIGTGFSTYTSPSVVPLYGQADHWGAVYKLEGSISSGTTTLSKTYFYDSASGSDGDGNDYIGSYSCSASTFKVVFYQMLNVPGDSNYNNHYVVLYDPPVGTDPAREQARFVNKELELLGAPGVTLPGEMMTEGLAAARVWEALIAADLDQDADWDRYAWGEAERAWKVAGTAPSGEPWDYYLVPILDGDDALAFVQLDAQDGAFQQVFIPEEPVPYVGLGRAAAREIAVTDLAADERLGRGQLTWEVSDRFTNTPIFPYYRFEILAHGQPVAEERVALVAGVASRVELH